MSLTNWEKRSGWWQFIPLQVALGVCWDHKCGGFIASEQKKLSHFTWLNTPQYPTASSLLPELLKNIPSNSSTQKSSISSFVLSFTFFVRGVYPLPRKLISIPNSRCKQWRIVADPAFPEQCHTAQKSNIGPCHLLVLAGWVLQKRLRCMTLLFKGITLVRERET